MGIYTIVDRKKITSLSDQDMCQGLDRLSLASEPFQCGTTLLEEGPNFVKAFNMVRVNPFTLIAGKQFDINEVEADGNLRIL